MDLFVVCVTSVENPDLHQNSHQRTYRSVDTAIQHGINPYVVSSQRVIFHKTPNHAIVQAVANGVVKRTYYVINVGEFASDEVNRLDVVLAKSTSLSSMESEILPVSDLS